MGTIEDSKLSLDEVLQLNLWGFFEECRDRAVPKLYIYEYLKRYSDDFDFKKLELLSHELIKLIDMECIEFFNDSDRKRRMLEMGPSDFGVILELTAIPGIATLREVLCDILSNEKGGDQCVTAKIRMNITKAQQVYVLDQLLNKADRSLTREQKTQFMQALLGYDTATKYQNTDTYKYLGAPSLAKKDQDKVTDILALLNIN